MSRISLKLISKVRIIPKVYYLIYKTESELDFIPGQFFSLEIAPKTFRSYSTISLDKIFPNYLNQKGENLTSGNYIAFMISTKPGGSASDYFEKTEVGTELSAIGPNGKFALQENSLPKVFVATGTGLAPFVCMIEKLLNQNSNSEIKLFFGSWKLSEGFVVKFFDKYLNNSQYPNFQIYLVPEDLEGETESEFVKVGRVTDVIPVVIQDFVNTEFYLCGHPGMVEAMKEVLINLGAENIIMEKFGK
jgi:all-trans-retinol 13,14-reductase